MSEEQRSKYKKLLLSGRASLRQGNIDNALSSFKQAIDCNSSEVQGYLELGRLLLCVGEQEEGLKILYLALEKFPNNAQVNIRLGAGLSKCRQHADAQNRYEKAVSCGNNLPLWVHYEAGSQVYSVILIDEYKLAYFPIPKCGCTTIKNALYKKVNSVSHRNPHAAFDYNRKLTKEDELKHYRNFFKAVIIRDPVKRFISYFYKNIISRKSLKNIYGSTQEIFNLNCIPDINTFVDRLEDYAYVFNDVRHHTLPQKAYIGHNLDNFNMICKLEDMDDFVNKISDITENRLSVLHRMKSNKKAEELLAELSPKSMHKLLKTYQTDYELLSQYYPSAEIAEEYKQLCIAIC